MNNKGFTIVETLVASMLTVLVGVLLVGFQSIIYSSQFLSFESHQTVDQTSGTIYQLARELRNTRQGENGAWPLELLNNEELVFYSDYDYDGQVEKLRYYVNNNQLFSEVIEPVGFPAIYPVASAKTKVVIENLGDTSHIFTYYNGDWPIDLVNNPLPAPASLIETKMVRIYFEVDSYQIETFVNLRLLKDNL